MLDNESEFVDVSGQHERGGSLPQSRVATAQGIDLEGIGNPGNPFTHYFTGFVLVTRWGTGLQKFLQECRCRGVARRGGSFGFLWHDRFGRYNYNFPTKEEVGASQNKLF